jgi:hypothetical protein
MCGHMLGGSEMPTFLIERNIPGIQELGSDALKAVARKSNFALAGFNSRVRWIHSYLVDGKSYCVYEAEDQELIREHSLLAGIPCDRITQVHGILDPSMGN